jgi:hypothetical protein
MKALNVGEELQKNVKTNRCLKKYFYRLLFLLMAANEKSGNRFLYSKDNYRNAFRC